MNLKMGLEKKAEIERLKAELAAPEKRASDAVSHSRSPSASVFAKLLLESTVLQRSR